jgi:serine/threonine protein kinase
VVKVATRTKDGKKVAVKIVSRAGMNPEEQKGLLREVEIMRTIDHPNIVKLYDFFEDEEKFYVVLEYIPGGELFERLVEKTYYTENEARDIAVTLFKAIKYIHDLGIVHRCVRNRKEKGIATNSSLSSLSLFYRFFLSFSLSFSFSRDMTGISNRKTFFS